MVLLTVRNGATFVGSSHLQASYRDISSEDQPSFDEHYLVEIAISQGSIEYSRKYTEVVSRDGGCAYKEVDHEPSGLNVLAVSCHEHVQFMSELTGMFRVSDIYRIKVSEKTSGQSTYWNIGVKRSGFVSLIEHVGEIDDVHGVVSVQAVAGIVHEFGEAGLCNCKNMPVPKYVMLICWLYSCSSSRPVS